MSDHPAGGGGFKPRNPEVDFHGHNRSNTTRRSATNAAAKLYRKGDGQAAMLCRIGHAISENLLNKTAFCSVLLAAWQFFIIGGYICA